MGSAFPLAVKTSQLPAMLLRAETSFWMQAWRRRLLTHTVRPRIALCYYHSITVSSKNISTRNSYLPFRCSHKLLQSQKQLRIERLAATLPLTIFQNSRCRHIQRFLSIKSRAHTCDLVPDY